MTSVIFFIIMVMMMTSINDVTADNSASRRSDDEQCQSLMTLVQQQAAALQRQEASMEAMQNRISVLEHSLSSTQQATALERQALNSSISLLQHTVSTRVGKQVAFSVRFRGSHALDVGSGGTLKYDQIITNVGNGYTPYSGRFTAPYAGVYAFFTSLRSDNNHSWIDLAIYKGSTMLVEVTAEGAGDPWDRGTGFVTTHLNRGDNVYVRHAAGGTFLEAGSFTTFTGLLVAAD